MNTNTLAVQSQAAWLRRLVPTVALLATVTLFGLAPHAAHADPRDGQQTVLDTVPADTALVYHVAYNGGEQGDIQVTPADADDAGALEIKVYDPDGNLVTRSFGLLDPDLHCSFDVDSAWAWRTYTIKVVNFSDHDIDDSISFF